MYSYAKGTCPFSHKISEEVISLPLHLFLEDDEIQYVIEKVIKSSKL
jgi:dTDP-4-amino-4,6-dideoxygalactose transaminase